MKGQQGAALIVVLVLLTVSLMLGLSSVQSSLIDERVAGNYRAITQAQMAAESGLSNFHGIVQEGAFKEEFYKEFAAKGTGDKLSLEGAWKNGSYASSHYEIRSLKKIDERHFSVESVGMADRDTASRVAYSYYSMAVPGEPVFVGPVACESLNFNADFMDSYDSRVAGGYGGSNSKRSLANIGIVSSDGVNMKISRGGTQLYGNILSRSSVEILGGGSRIIGNIRANGDVSVLGSSQVTGDISAKGNVRLGNSTTVGGGVTSDRDVIMESWGAVINGNVASAGALHTGDGGQIKGNVNAVKSITTSGWSQRIYGLAQAGEFVSQGGGGLDVQVPNRKTGNVDVLPVESIKERQCDFLNLAGGIASLEDVESLGALNVDNGRSYQLLAGSRSEGGALHDEVAFMGEQAAVVRLDSLNVGGGAMFEVSGGKPIVLFVDGDVDLGGGATFKIKGEGTKLKIVTKGSFRQSLDADKLVIDVDTDSGSNVVDDDNNPIFSLYTTGDVSISGAAKFYGSIYAPYSTVEVNAGGGFFGAMHVKNLTVSGGDGVHFDEALLESDVGGGGEGENNDPVLVGFCAEDTSSCI
ncbi:polymer-forming cytoskeletal protein [Halomonas sp. McH1-25]|uniref:DUF7305 domain-containing protein n=1 Tax=unclassified Halomonas TaxID=2609666 RepID=UPI001EF604BD|nr:MULTISPECIES: polymer-forming cytoskeletal protein [unclassified Halomonas]MCG7601901.1 polymer-forming cytoskeletal protein [Halomonas sp. McH1-25]MCP1343908.1 polymer-forming cytoskeletal protein [Halomonas sp. FL8]MCP1361880.1 polymer-forming cytoskeletal protein [Halomonas sp. BBD45]MCP1363922.1 polymer-forming cytoskeletal protein [Halomonas sp. BBD48]